MLDNWLNPSQNDYADESTIGHKVLSILPAQFIGRQLLHIVTDGSEFAKKSKVALYQLKNHFNNIDLYDLGNLKNTNPEFVIAILRELSVSQGRVVFISEKDCYFDSIFRGLEYGNEHIRMAFMNSKLDQLLEESTARSLKSEKLLNISALGYQRHFCSPKILSYLHDSFVHHLSFGQLRQDITRAEPILRTVHAAAIDTAILKNDQGLPNGIDALEICQLMKYCGMSGNLKVMSISNSANCSPSRIEPLIGQMLWYFIEGVCIAEEDISLKTSEHFQEHLVQTDYSNQSLTFWKSNKTNRWWFEIPNAEDKRGNIYPCNKEDYDLACRNEISAYILDQINLDH